MEPGDGVALTRGLLAGTLCLLICASGAASRGFRLRDPATGLGWQPALQDPREARADLRGGKTQGPYIASHVTHDFN